MVHDRRAEGVRGIVFAVGLIAFVAILAWRGWALLGPREPNITRHDPPHAPNHDHSAGGSRCKPEHIGLITNIAKRAKQEERCQQAQRDENAREESLDESARSVNAAEQAVLVANYQSKVIFWQTFATIGAFIAALAAVFYAKRAADIADVATKTQLRAYVLPHEAGFVMDEKHNISITLRIKNFGQTPASDVKSWIHSWIESYPLSIELPQPGDDFEMGQAILAPGAYFNVNQPHGCPVSLFSFREIENGRAALYVYGRIVYLDRFGKDQTSTYMFFCRGTGALKAGILSPYTTGNNAT